MSLELRNGSWHRTTGASDPPATGISVWWAGGPPDSAVARTDAGAEALEQLRALGYVQ